MWSSGQRATHLSSTFTQKAGHSFITVHIVLIDICFLRHTSDRGVFRAALNYTRWYGSVDELC